MRQCVWHVSLLALLFVLSAGIPSASAQFDTASVVGTVKDASGATVPDAKVTLTNTQTGVSVVRTTTTDGNYEFVTVRPGIYIVSAEKPGFSIALIDNVQVQVAARLRVDMQMAVGQVSEKVEVTASSPLVETDTSQRSQVITGEQMRELALNGREYSALALLSTGVDALTSFNAGGMIGTVDIKNKVPTPCLMVTQLQKGQFVRMAPKKKGTFDCNERNAVTIKADLIKGS